MPVSFIRQRAASGYIGPGDIVANAIAFYGLRAYDAAVAATGTQAAVNVRRASDNATQDILILTNGNLDVATANTFAGVDATGNATTSGLSTTIAITGASSTPHVGSTVTGTGISVGCYIVSVGSFVAGAGTIVVSAAQNITVAETLTLTWGLYVTEWYDQSGNALSVIQTTAGEQPQLLLTGLNGLPTVAAVAANSQSLSQNDGAVGTAYTISNVAARTGAFSTTGGIMGATGGIGGGGAASSYFYTADTVVLYAGVVDPEAPATDGQAHAMQFVGNDPNSIVYVDGTAGSPGNAGGNPFGAGTQLFYSGAFGTSNISEAILYGISFSGVQAGALTANQKAYWGTP